MDERQPCEAFCLVCDKELEYTPGPGHTGNVHDAGFMLVTFHYGSRHDQRLGYEGRKTMNDNETDLQQLLNCDQIETFICDDCFEKKLDKMNGYDLDSGHKRTKRFGPSSREKFSGHPKTWPQSERDEYLFQKWDGVLKRLADS